MEELQYILFPSVQLHITNHSEDTLGQNNRNSGVPKLADPAVISSSEASSSCTSPYLPSLPNTAATAGCPRGATSSGKETRVDDMSCIRKNLIQSGLTQKSVNIIMSSWRKGTTC